MSISRRAMLKAAAAAAPALYLRKVLAAGGAAPPTATAPATMPANLPPKPSFPVGPRVVADGPFKANWESLKQYKTPDWFRDAKFGIWAHWSAQCQPEQGDWYARNMYIQGERQNTFHVA